MLASSVGIKNACLIQNITGGQKEENFPYSSFQIYGKVTVDSEEEMKKSIKPDFVI